MINLLPYKEKSTIKRLMLLRILRLYISAGILLVLIAGVILFPTFISINTRYALANAQVATLERDGVIARDVDVTALLKRSRALEPKLALRVPMAPSEYIDLVHVLLPAGVTMDRYAMQEEGVLELSGIAQNRESLKHFIEILQKDTRIASVDNPISNFVKNKNSTFKMTISFKLQQ